MRIFRHAVGYLRFVREYRRFLSARLDPEAARAVVRRRMEDRTDRFVRLVRGFVFEQPDSPYAALMRQADCAFSDFESMARSDGVEETLKALRAAGVYVSYEEFKGRRPLERDGRTIPLGPKSFDNPGLSAFFEGESGASTGRAVRVFIDLDHIGSLAPATLLSLVDHGLQGLPTGMWHGVLPDPTGLTNLLRHARWGSPHDVWFTPHPPRRSWRHRMFSGSVVALGPAFGTQTPRPRIVDIGDEEVIAQWLAGASREGGAVFSCTPSKAVRISQSAYARGWPLDDVRFIVGGEPITTGKATSIQRSGASYIARYAFSEHGAIGNSCRHSSVGDEIHVFEDSVALIQAERELPRTGGTVGSLHFTSLVPTGPKLLLNVEADDFGVVERRACSCMLGELGFRTFVRSIRSFSKLTTEGTTLVGSDVESLLETELPRRFGGGPLDYQLVEQEDRDGLTRLALFIHPRLEIEDEAEVTQAFFASADRRILADADSIRVVRREPLLTARGKFVPLQSLPGHETA